MNRTPNATPGGIPVRARAPLAPHAPPEPAPQAAAWHRALRVIGCAPPGKIYRISKTYSMDKTVVRRATRHRC